MTVVADLGSEELARIHSEYPRWLERAREAIDVHAVRLAFPAWTIFKGDEKWFAIRRGSFRFDYCGPGSLLLPVITDSTLADLACRLSLQDLLDSMTPGELARVYALGGLKECA